MAAVGERDELTGKTLGEFVLRERIGEGGFGAVYRAEQPLLGREAVVKILHRQLTAHDNALQRFLREARLASRLDHPYAAHVYAFGAEPEGIVWIAMERVRGTPLDSWIAERGPLEIDELVPFFERLAEVVHSVHEVGIVHRDLKPSNVMVTERAGRLLPKLLDLGIAKLIDDPAARTDDVDDDVHDDVDVTPSGLDGTLAASAIAKDETLAVTPAASTAAAPGPRSSALAKDETLAVTPAPTPTPTPTPTPADDPRPSSHAKAASHASIAVDATMDAHDRTQMPSSIAAEVPTGLRIIGTDAPHGTGGGDDGSGRGARDFRSIGAITAAESMLARLTHAGATIGSPPYMAPEQWRDAWSAGPRADVYSLGIVAFECLTGRRPFTATTTIGYQEEHTHGAIPRVGERFPPALDRFFARALAKRAEERPATALELAAALRIACGKADESTTLPALDSAVRDAWLADAPEPLAGAVAMLEAARNAHQARDAVWDLVRAVVRYLVGIALVTRAQLRSDHDEPQLVELLRALRTRELADEERVRLLRLLVRPFATRRAAYPIPELVDLVVVGAREGARDGAREGARDGERHVLDRLFELRAATDANAFADDLVRSHLSRLLPAVAQFLRATSFVLDRALVVVTASGADATAERWVGLRRARRPIVRLASAREQLAPRQPLLVDRDGAVVVHLGPVMQVAAPSVGMAEELFVFDRHGRHGALMLATPSGYELHDPALWDWLGEHVLGGADASAEAHADEGAPYLGLATFQASDADRFVGREREVDAFVNRLRTQALQVVVGASGAGKSSFVHAGVVPALPRTWSVVTMRPGAAPLAALGARLATAAAASDAETRGGDGGDGVVVVVVDQLEELFTACGDETERVGFAARLAALASGPEARVRVICTIRDDFLMKLEALAPLRARLGGALVLLGNPSVEDLVRTVVEPARRVGYTLSDDNLACEMAESVAERPGALALLSFTASQLWELRDRRFKQLTRQAYEGMGGVAGALGAHAEDTLANLAVDDQRLARDVFCRLVTAEGTRALVSPAELRQVLASERADLVVEKLVAARLVVVVDAEGGEGRVELVHEALVTAWPRLGAWLREDAEGARMRDQLHAAARQWLERGRPRDLLWRGDVLAELERWRRRPSPVALADGERAFAEASRAEAARTKRRRQAILVGAFAALAVTIVVLVQLTTTAREQRARADVEAERAAASATEAQRRLAEQYEEQGRLALLADRSGPALVFLLAAIDQGAPRTTALDFMLDRAVHRLALQRAVLRGHTARVQAVSLSPDRTQAVTASTDGTLRVWDLATRTARATITTGDPNVFVALWSPRGDAILAAGDSGVPRLFAPDGRRLAELRWPAQPASWMTPAFSPDGATVLVPYLDGTLIAWDARTGAERARVTTEIRAPIAVAYDPTGALAMVWGHVGFVPEVRDARTLARVTALAQHKRPVTSVAFSPGHVAVASRDRTITLWDRATWKLVHHLRGDANVVENLAFAPDGKRLLTTSRDGTARIWDVATGETQRYLVGHHATIRGAAFTPDGSRVVTASADGTARLWDAASGVPLETFEGHQRDLTALAVTDEIAITTGVDGTARVYGLASERRVVVADQVPRALAFSADGTRLAATSDGAMSLIEGAAAIRAIEGAVDGALHPTDPQRAALLYETELHLVAGTAIEHRIAVPVPIWILRYLPDGKHLALADAKGAVRIVEVATGKVTELTGHTARLHALATADDLVATASEDATARLWKLSQRASIVLPHDERVRAIAIDPARRYVVTGSTDRRTRVWDVQTGALVRVLGASDATSVIAFDGGGRHVITAGDEPHAQVWRLANGALVATLEGHSNVLRGAASVFDDLVVTTGDETVRVWDRTSGRPLAIERAHTIGVGALALRPDGTAVATAAFDRTITWTPLRLRRHDLAALRRVAACVPFALAHGRLVARPRSTTSPCP